MGGSSACVSWREELHVSDLGDGCPVAVPPAVTTQTTEQPSTYHALSWSFQGNWSYRCFAWKCSTIKCRNCGATSGVAGLSAQQGQQRSWDWRVPCSCSSFKAFGKSPAKENIIVSNLNVFLGSQKCMVEATSSIPCCLWGYRSAWVTTVNPVHGLFFQT